MSFDCFGVMTEDGWMAFLNRYAKPESLQDLVDSNRKLDLGLIDFEQHIEEVVDISGVERDEALRIIVVNHTVNSKLVELIKRLKPNYKIGMISNIGGNRLSEFLPQEAIELFDVITLSFAVGAIKPQPEIYQKHLDDMGVEPVELIFTDDRQENCRGAETLGIKAIYYQNMIQLEDDLKAAGVAF